MEFYCCGVRKNQGKVLIHVCIKVRECQEILFKHMDGDPDSSLSSKIYMFMTEIGQVKGHFLVTLVLEYNNSEYYMN